MGNLILHRRVGQTIHLSMNPGADPQEVLDQLADGITITLSDITDRRAGLAITAPPDVETMRAELCSQNIQSL
ncbi:carbon storage regulator [Pseudomonas paralcaligenes]|uniref:carbon storage regulator n=1 Tax=Pseudomonas paralcaligenes TaxID=2772558 RepID=UPI001C80AF0E|nr:carbon storage regulator [Pseudomonas paralcaligenes]